MDAETWWCCQPVVQIDDRFVHTGWLDAAMGV